MIPVYINNRDLLGPVQAMVAWLARVPHAAPVIVDNASTYPPLLAWYDELGRMRDPPARVRRLSINAGPRGAEQGLLDHWALRVTHYVITDPDLDCSGVPVDVLELLHEGLTRYPWAVKAGLSLAIDDLPDGYPLKATVLERERPHWGHLTECGRFHVGDLDTTFAMYRVKPAWTGAYGPALRAAPPYAARHLPWYHTDLDRPADFRYYLDHANPQGTLYTALTRARA